ncbi:hypothetical protein [Sphingopyxis sp. USTB-05]|uniref:hypothetical protein n=1 Tax=Sphingopyxis sp. USTB-05 TaxID=2830667 RepID=UPI002078CDB4|nr:hypothetical protein [Sphingopyxis sp. USTB-05]USI79076.1 hypothetical protein KEC45_09385 [Sphingopyxis sp. USTB-05]
MQSDPKLNALITRNIGEFEQTRAYLDDILWLELFKAFSSVFDSATDNASLVSYRNEEDEEFWFRKKDWVQDNEAVGRGRFAFYLGYQIKGGNDESWLSNFTGTSPSGTGAGFYFEQRCVRHGGKWNGFISDHNPAVKAILDAGFSLEKPSRIYLPLKFDQEELALAFEAEAPEDALGPLRHAIEKIIETLPLFDGLIAQANSQLEMREG